MAGTEKVKEAVQGAASPENKQGAMDLEQPKSEQFDLAAHISNLVEQYNAVLISNEKVIASNQSVIDSLDSFKEHSADFVKQLVEGADEKNQPIIDSIKSAVESITIAGIPVGTGTVSDFKPAKRHVDPEAEYVVSKGNSFADRNDITKKYVEGEDVTHLGYERLQSLLDQGLIEEA